MFTSFTVKKFRCFRELTVNPLGRINLIAGKNNVGKTALLEALYLHAGPRILKPPRMHNFFRALERFNQANEETWEWLFLGKTTDEAICMSGSWDRFRRNTELRIEDTGAKRWSRRAIQRLQNGRATPLPPRHASWFSNGRTNRKPRSGKSRLWYQPMVSSKQHGLQIPIKLAFTIWRHRLILQPKMSNALASLRRSVLRRSSCRYFRSWNRGLNDWPYW